MSRYDIIESYSWEIYHLTMCTKPYSRVWLSLISTCKSCALVNIILRHSEMLSNTRFNPLFQKIVQKMRLIVVCSSKSAKQSDWLCQHSGSGPRCVQRRPDCFWPPPHSLEHETKWEGGNLSSLSHRKIYYFCTLLRITWCRETMAVCSHDNFHEKDPEQQWT